VSLPFCTWLMWQFFQTIPMTYEESAWINGAGLTRTLVEVILPMARPGIIAVSIFAFAFSWNDFTFAIILMTEQNMQTLPVGVNSFLETTANNWGYVQSAGVLITLPPLLIIIFLQRYLLVGFGISDM
jgi:multiple sugar transport system permease protein